MELYKCYSCYSDKIELAYAYDRVNIVEYQFYFVKCMRCGFEGNQFRDDQQHAIDNWNDWKPDNLILEAYRQHYKLEKLLFKHMDDTLRNKEAYKEHIYRYNKLYTQSLNRYLRRMDKYGTNNINS